MVDFQKREKESFIVTFLSKQKLISFLQLQIYGMPATKSQKILYQKFLKCLKLKVTKGELWIFIQLEMTSYQEQSVPPRHRLRPNRVKEACQSQVKDLHKELQIVSGSRGFKIIKGQNQRSRRNCFTHARHKIFTASSPVSYKSGKYLI